MDPTPELAVTLSPKLYDRLRSEAEMLGLPLPWLVASLVIDTVDTVQDEVEEVSEPELACAC
jgi:hypothetical protein